MTFASSSRKVNLAKLWQFHGMVVVAPEFVDNFENFNALLILFLRLPNPSRIDSRLSVRAFLRCRKSKP